MSKKRERELAQERSNCSILIQQDAEKAVQNLPLKSLYRMISSFIAITNENVAKQLQVRNYDPEVLRTEFTALIERNQFFIHEKGFHFDDNAEKFNDEVTNMINKSTNSRKWFAIEVESESRGDSWDPDVPNSSITTTHNFMIFVPIFSKDKQVETFDVFSFETIIQIYDRLMTRNSDDSCDSKFLSDKVNLNIHQVIALYPSLYETIMCMCGSEEKLLQALANLA
jgi:hypothetical protein